MKQPTTFWKKLDHPYPSWYKVLIRWQRGLGCGLGIALAGLVLLATPAVAAPCEPQYGGVPGADPNRKCNTGPGTWTDGRHYDNSNDDQFSGHLYKGEPRTDVCDPWIYPASSIPGYSIFEGWEGYDSHFGGGYPGLNAAQMVTDRTYPVWTPSWTALGDSLWVMLSSFDTPCPAGSANAGAYTYIQTGQYTNPYLVGNEQPAVWMEGSSCVSTAGKRVIISTAQFNPGVAGHTYAIHPYGSGWIFTVDSYTITTWGDTHAAYDTPEYLGEQHMPFQQSFGDHINTVHVSHLRYGMPDGTWAVPVNGHWYGGNGTVKVESAYWQHINGPDASQFYLQDQSC